MPAGFYKGKEIAIKSGYSQEIDDRYKDISIDIETFLDINVKTEKLLMVSLRIALSLFTSVWHLKPEHSLVFNDFFASEDLEKIKEKLCWMEIQFPEYFLMKPLHPFSALPMLSRDEQKIA